MPIVPLPVFEKEADPQYRSALSDEEIYARLEAPKTIVVRYGYLKYVGEFPYNGDAKPGCGSKLVARTPRGTEVVEMLTTTCSNSGCGKSVSRREMLDYIDNSGGKDFPFTGKGRVIRVASIEDLNQQSALEPTRREAVKAAKALVAEMQLPMKIVEAEPIIGGECMTFYYMSEARLDFRDLVQRLASQFATRIEMRQVGARDEARLVADYERCGQHCCCKNFLKVLKPVSMRQAKVQKATLDPLKISGRCGRLMCCLRYEDQTYKELKSHLPSRNKRVGTSEGPGIVVDTKILVQLVLVRLEHDMREIAVPVEELMDPEKCPKPARVPDATELRQARERRRDERGPGRDRERQRGGEGREAPPERPTQPPAPSIVPEPAGVDNPLRGLSEAEAAARAGEEGGKRKRRRRRKRKGGGGGAGGSAESVQQRTPSEGDRYRQQDAFRQQAQDLDDDRPGDNPETADGVELPQGGGAVEQGQGGPDGGSQGLESRRKRRRRRRRRRDGQGDGGGAPPNAGPPTAQ